MHATSDHMRQDLTRAWTEQLYFEYGNVCFHFNLRLGTPNLRIEDLTSNWGEWRPATRCLVIAKRLIELHTWDVVIEVLKHEMAHQMVSDQALGGTPHGNAFQAACLRLGVAEWARLASGELPQQIPSWRDKLLSEDEERLLKRAEKLLALAASTNEHEATLAMQRVRQLYAKYNLERLAAKKSSTHVYCIIGAKKKSISAEETLIFSILTEHFFVRAIYLDHYDAQAATKYKAVELLGTRENVLMAEYVYHFLRHQLASLWTDYKKRNGKPGKARRSYMLGLLSGFRQKLSSEAHTPFESSTSRQHHALMAQADHFLKEFIQERHPRLATRRTGSSYGDSASFAAGVSDGGTITLHRGVTQQGGNRGLQIKG